MPYSMNDMIGNRLSHIFPNPGRLNSTPFSVSDLRDCIITSIIKAAYEESEPKQSLRANRGHDKDDVRMRDSRSLAYAQHYRTLQYEEVKARMGEEIPELLPDDVSSIDGKLSGHKISAMQYYELNTMADHPVFKAIVSKRICNVKKISNQQFCQYMQDYEEIVKKELPKLSSDNDDDVIFAAIALFTLEWKYNIELFYACAVEAEAKGTTDIPVHRIGILCAEVAVPLIPHFLQTLHTESRFVLHRLKLVPLIFGATEAEWSEIEWKMWNYLGARNNIEKEIVRKWSMAEFFSRFTTRKQWADFFREQYRLGGMYTPKEWNKKRIQYVRKLYRTMIKDMPTPKL